MKLAMLSRWNSACGVSLLAELVGREWIKGGHRLTVFAPKQIRPVKDDEEYVIRCCSDEGDHEETLFHAEPFLNTDCDILVVQRVEWVPLEPLKEIFSEMESLKSYDFIELRQKLAPMDGIFAYLHASDVYLMHKQKEETRPGEAVVPRAILMCLGALTPTMTQNTEFVWFLDREVMKYSSSDELKGLLVKAFKGDRIVRKTVKAAEEYALHHSPEKIAKEFITLFERLAG